jgi:hypothetical protein
MIMTAIVISTPGAAIPEYEARAFSLPTVLALAPTGKLDRDLVEAIRASAMPNPGWIDYASSIMRRVGGLPGADEIERISRPEKSDFPMRAAGAAVDACGAVLHEVGVPNVLRSPSGAFFYVPAKRDRLGGGDDSQ